MQNLNNNHTFSFTYPHTDKYTLCNCEAILSIVLGIYYLDKQPTPTSAASQETQSTYLEKARLST